MFAADPNPLGGDLPGPPNLRVDQRVPAAPVGRALGDSDELLRLYRQQRQGHRTNAIDLQPRREDFGGAGDKKSPGRRTVLSNAASSVLMDDIAGVHILRRHDAERPYGAVPNVGAQASRHSACSNHHQPTPQADGPKATVMIHLVEHPAHSRPAKALNAGMGGPSSGTARRHVSWLASIEQRKTPNEILDGRALKRSSEYGQCAQTGWGKAQVEELPFLMFCGRQKGVGLALTQRTHGRFHQRRPVRRCTGRKQRGLRRECSVRHQ